ncbi:MAG: hypothetical protein ACRC2J_16275 [Microcoleaceae cyanobacterium]
MNNLILSGDYVRLVVNGSEQEELNRNTDDVEYNRYSDGKVSLKFGRRTIEMVDPTTFQIDGVAVVGAADFVTKIETLFTKYGASNNASSYLVYTALLSQSGTDAPVATVLQNTLGGTVVWTRAGIGEYEGTLAGAFTENKTFIIFNPAAASDVFGFASAVRLSGNQIQLATGDGAQLFDEYLTTNSSIEIRVYP